MKGLPFLLFFYALIPFSPISEAVDSINVTHPISDGQTLVSSGQSFVLGFFSPHASKNRYLGIWYKNISFTVVWVANRDNPLKDFSGDLSIGNDGNLVLLDGNGNVIWSSNSSTVPKNSVAVAQLLNSGNLVLRDNLANVFWQSFDHPTDTLLPGMKLGWDFRNGLNRNLTSWRSIDDPYPGDYSFSVDPSPLAQIVLRKGLTELYRTGPWGGDQFSSGSVLPADAVIKPMFISNQEEMYYVYEDGDNVISRLVMTESNLIQHFTWNVGPAQWVLLYTLPEDVCDSYDRCGAYGYCDINMTPNCQCLNGFTPKSPTAWSLLNWSGGCVRKAQLGCRNGEGFVKYKGVTLPDAALVMVNKSMDPENCYLQCLNNCSCMAYAEMNISGEGNGCLTWFGDLIDIRQYNSNGQDLYIRMAASELGLNSDSGKISKGAEIAIVIFLVMVMVMLLLGSVGWYIVQKWRTKRVSELNNQENEGRDRDKSPLEEDLELPLFDFNTIVAATNNFSDSNKIGKGGFGPVYKGKLVSGQEIAVKRLSEESGQGLKEFKNEVVLISKLQHRNLVGLLGYSVQREERMLIYDYLPNGSLDSILFDKTRSTKLDWHKRFNIIEGIARGLLYLHRDSKLRIVHRDLKASNVLLDSEMNPKISDFGMARAFRGDESEDNTKLVVGTYGYMPPEYAVDGLFSVKSDVYSFGVLVLEIVSGNKNRGFCHPDHEHNLLGHAWKLWNEGKPLELIDRALDRFSAPEALRCIQVGILCVQQRPEDRPTMSSVLLMLDSENTTLTQPKRPGFYIERSLKDTGSSSNQQRICSEELAITVLEGR
ncbi:G-type lectin S-receptor-like serine/threonine-protein kinase At4g27290 [Macadamia integrifolia]|uniref:G-type lectin S-receptor-like serine/threonine-protein kinase At4g27290 n=1 Tax=Macadamia integrifolia TaxID=60698 RepID=UPI001C52BDD7|nr:G-type lectin S-receptor-like serine/threonine-protein kinase At4g27290 [Macadamia integrifolia]